MAAAGAVSKWRMANIWVGEVTNKSNTKLRAKSFIEMTFRDLA